MRWAHGYLLLWLVCGVIVVRDFLSVYPQLRLPVPTKQVWKAVFSYIVSLAILGAFLPGKIQIGVPLSDGTRLKYKCNGLLVTGVVITGLATAVWGGYISGSWVADNYAELFVAANIFAFSLSIYLFVVGRLSRPRNWLRKRSLWDDFVMGAELNPFVFGVNLKFFSYRPSMAGWLILNLSFLYKQYEMFGFITERMLLYQLTTAWYIFDYFVHEAKMIFTWDIIAEHFGLMLVWGDYVFIVFAFSVQNFFLLKDTRPMSYFELALIGLTFCLGFAIFRGANSQKHQFKTHPKALIWGNPPLTVGGKLLASGFWGYFYFIYLLLLTVHREKRDDDRCSKKYKSTWDEYCLQVPYRMVPFVY